MQFLHKFKISAIFAERGTLSAEILNFCSNYLRPPPQYNSTRNAFLGAGRGFKGLG
jgi:hypothetical protein